MPGSKERAIKVLAKAIVKEIPLSDVGRLLSKGGKLSDADAAKSGDWCGAGLCGNFCGDVCGIGCQVRDQRQDIVDPVGHLELTKEDLVYARHNIDKIRLEIVNEVQQYAKGIRSMK